jgi:hypothetical protein
MNISDQELRGMVRAAVARARQGPAPAGAGDSTPFRMDASHARLPLVAGGDEDGQCLIEPAVRCVHCGYCQSLGH